MDIRKTVEEIRAKYKKKESDVAECMKMERYFRELKTELYIKRDEVHKLRAEREVLQIENGELKKALEVANKSLEEKQFNLNIFFNKSKNMEEDLTSKRESLMKIQMQHKMMSCELEVLKEKLYKTENEKSDLSGKLEMFETKLKYNNVYHNQILKRDGDLRRTMENTMETFGRIKAEQALTIDLTKKTQLVEESLNKLQLLNKRYEEIKIEKDKLQGLYIKTKAKCDKLEENQTLSGNDHQSNLLMSLIFKKWKSSFSHHEEQQRKKNEILTKLTRSFSDEKILNATLLGKIEELKKGNSDLKQDYDNARQLSANVTGELNARIKDLEEKINKAAETEIKLERIEIIDD